MEITFVLVSFQIAILIMAIVIHEVSHGVMALWLGDATAKHAGRLTLNPFKHMEFWGSFIVPLLMISTMGFGFGWAKPVPYNPYNLRDQKRGPALVGLAGPFSNIILALLFGLGARFIPLGHLAKIDIARNIFDYQSLAIVLSGSFLAIFFWIFMMIVTINVFLAFFNLIPIPPLDGSKLLFTILSLKTETKIMLEQFGFVFLLMFIIFFSAPLGIFLSSVLSLFFKYIAGI